MAEREHAPTCMYRAGEDGAVEAQIFDHPDDIPKGKGWVDDPAKIKTKRAK